MKELDPVRGRAPATPPGSVNGVTILKLSPTLFSGILKACAKTYFKTELQVNMLSKEVIDVKDSEMGKREHVVFSVTVGGAEKKNNMPPPTFVAQTKRQAEGQIAKTVCVYSSRNPAFLPKQSCKNSL